MAYEDAPQYIGYGATISAPHMHAISACLLEDSLRPGSKALDIGCGSGYFVALLAKMVVNIVIHTKTSSNKKRYSREAR